MDASAPIDPPKYEPGVSPNLTPLGKQDRHDYRPYYTGQTELLPMMPISEEGALGNDESHTVEVRQMIDQLASRLASFSTTMLLYCLKLWISWSTNICDLKLILPYSFFFQHLLPRQKLVWLRICRRLANVDNGQGKQLRISWSKSNCSHRLPYSLPNITGIENRTLPSSECPY